MNRLDHRPEIMLTFFALMTLSLSLGSLGIIPLWCTTLLLRFCSAPMVLQELLRSRGFLCVRVRTLNLALIEPSSFFFGAPEVARPFVMLLILPVYCMVFHGLQGCKASEYVSNPDIVGSGVRLSMYLLFLVVFASLFIGSFHSGPSGTKELGIAILISMSRFAEITKMILFDSILTDRRSGVPNNQPPKSQL
jgi:hypothetical protein